MTDLLIVDDHEIVRAGIKRLFENTPNLYIVTSIDSLHDNTILILMEKNYFLDLLLVLANSLWQIIFKCLSKIYLTNFMNLQDIVLDVSNLVN